MSALFHPKENLIVSASLDQSVRVWDFSGLRKKNYSVVQDDSSRQNDLFGNSDVAVAQILDGHDRGVNWATFSKTQPLIVSGADDRLIKLWRYQDTRGYELDTLRGHYNNVSCVTFHPTLDLVISNSEDTTIRVWDTQKRTVLKTFRREHDRFWILAAHPERNTLAAGHDSGMIVFKLEHERPAFTVFGKLLFFIKDKLLKVFDLSTGKEKTSMTIRRSSVPLSGQPRYLHYNPAENALLVISEDTEAFTYDLYQLPSETAARSADKPLGDNESRKGSAKGAVWIARNRFVVFDKSKKLLVKNLQNQITKTIASPLASTAQNILPASTGSILLIDEDKVSLFDLQQQTIEATIKTTGVKTAVWSSAGDAASRPSSTPIFVALIGKEGLFIADRQLNVTARVLETGIKSGVWHETGVFIYSTSTHIKYCLPNGDNGIIRTLDIPIYIVAVKGERVFCLDRNCKCCALTVDITEFLFKLALIQKNYQQVLKMVKEADLIGQSIIAYLQRKGFPEIALHFVKDEKTRFNLAIECGNIEVALESAKVVNEDECWEKLAVEALRQGNHQIVEMAYQKTRNYERLSFLYLITGNLVNLQKMKLLAEKRGDVMSRFHNALFLGDVEDRVELLTKTGQINLAYITAKGHDLVEQEQYLASIIHKQQLRSNSSLENSAAEMGKESSDTPHSQPVLPQIPKKAGKLLCPPTPINHLTDSNWPLLTTSVSILETMLSSARTTSGAKSSVASVATATAAAAILDIDDQAAGKWGGDLDIPDDNDDNLGANTQKEGENEGDNEELLGAGDGWDPLELEGLETLNISSTLSKPGSSIDNVFVAPRVGPSFGDNWSRNSKLVADHVAAGSVESAMQLLRQQVGVSNFLPLKSFFQRLYLAAQCSIPSPIGFPSLIVGIDRNWQDNNPKTRLPVNPFSLPPIIEDIQQTYEAVTGGKFAEALKKFVDILHSILFVSLSSRQEANEVKEIISICRNYIIGIQTEIARKEEADPARQCELAAYFTHCNLQNAHVALSLRSAMSIAYKAQNFKTAASFARRLLEFNPPAALATQAKKVIAFVEKNNSDQHKLNYDERNPFVICGKSLTPIYKGSQMVRCPFCAACFQPQFKSQTCSICQIAEIGLEAQGLQLLPLTK